MTTNIDAQSGITYTKTRTITQRTLTPTAISNLKYVADASNTATTETHTAQHLELDLTPRFNEVIIPCSVAFELGGETYYDSGGRIYYRLDVTTGQGIAAGSINYRSGKVTLTAWRSGVAADFKLVSLLTSVDKHAVTQVCFRLPTAPIVPQTLQLLGTTLSGQAFSVTANASSEMDDAVVQGYVDVQSGLVVAFFGSKVTAVGNESEPWYDAALVDSNGMIWKPEPVFVDTLTYNAVAYTTVPLNSDLLNIETTRLPLDGRVTIYRPGDMIVIASRFSQNLGTAFNPGQLVQLNETNLSLMCLMDADNKHILAEKYDYDLDAGTLTFKTPLDLSDYKMPLFAKYAKEENKQVSKVDINGTLTLTKPLTRSYDPANTYVSSALNAGDLKVRASKAFSQQIWTQVWSDERIGDPLLFNINDKDYPIELDDRGAITGRWVIVFTSSSTYDLYEENLGLVTTGNTTADLAPANPAGGNYFILRAAAFGGAAGSGSQAGYCVRFNTFGALMKAWAIRATQQSNTVYPQIDGATLMIRGNTVDDNS